MKTPKPPRQPRPNGWHPATPTKKQMAWRPTTPTKKQVARGNKFLAPVLALTFVLAGSVVWGEPTDYVLTVREHGIDTLICAKSGVVCEIAREAIRTGRWPIADPGATTFCQPSPNCFDPASNCIEGYNCR